MMATTVIGYQLTVSLQLMSPGTLSTYKFKTVSNNIALRLALGVRPFGTHICAHVSIVCEHSAQGYTC